MMIIIHFLQLEEHSYNKRNPARKWHIRPSTTEIPTFVYSAYGPESEFVIRRGRKAERESIADYTIQRLFPSGAIPHASYPS